MSVTWSDPPHGKRPARPPQGDRTPAMLEELVDVHRAAADVAQATDPGDVTRAMDRLDFAVLTLIRWHRAHSR